jgi:hypothetical protein
MGTTSPWLSKKEQGAYQESAHSAKDEGQEAHNQGSLEDNYRIKSCK